MSLPFIPVSGNGPLTFTFYNEAGVPGGLDPQLFNIWIYNGNEPPVVNILNPTDPSGPNWVYLKSQAVGSQASFTFEAIGGLDGSPTSIVAGINSMLIAYDIITDTWYTLADYIEVP